MTTPSPNKHHLFDVSQTLAEICHMLTGKQDVQRAMQIGATVIEACVDIVVYGQVMQFSRSPTQILEQEGMSREMAKELVESAISHLNLQIASHMGYVSGNKDYNWFVNPISSTLHIVESMKTITPIRRDGFDPEAMMRVYLSDIVDNGGWVSERLMRQLGR